MWDSSFPTIFAHSEAFLFSGWLTLPVGVVDPPLFDLCWSCWWFLLNCLLHDAAGVLHGALLQHARAPLHAAHHNHHQHQQQQQHYHPGEVLIDVKIIMGTRPWGPPTSGPVVAGNPTSSTSVPLLSYLANTRPNPDYLWPLKTLHHPLAGTWYRVRNGRPQFVFYYLLSCWVQWNPWWIMIWWGGSTRPAKE